MGFKDSDGAGGCAAAPDSAGFAGFSVDREK
jgi:hypothetical protein